MNHPDTRLTWSGEYGIAYQVVGSGPKDLLYLPQFLSNVEWNWRVPEHARFMSRLASFSRLIVMDPRGVGCSDRLPPGTSATLEEKVDDVLAVLGATSSFGATLFGGGRSAFVAMLAAATHPDRFDGLILFAATPSWIRSDELPWGESEEEADRFIEQFRRLGSVQEWAGAWAGLFAPSLPGASVQALGSYAALTIGVGGWIAEDEMLNRVDLTPILPTIIMPTLVLHRTEDPLERIESGRFIAERIPNAKLVELPGRDGLPWIGETEDVLEEIEVFLTGGHQESEPDLAIATVLFTDIVDSTSHAARVGNVEWSRLLERHHKLVREELARFGGAEVDTAGDGFLAAFDGAARAVRCATTIADRVGDIGLAIRAGLHAGEVQRTDRGVRGIAVHVGARVMALASPSEVLVSSTVRDLAAGSGISFEDAGEHELKGVPDRWRLYRVIG